ncbi:hypothetical protein C3L33_02034, partial [Rhododendron williamsianum]
MEWNAETLQFLSQCFLNTLSPYPEPRRAAESRLSEASDRPNYGLAVLRLVAEPSVDEPIRQAAAVNFKNHLRSRWSSSEEEPNAQPQSLAPDEKEQIKSRIVSLMLSSAPRIQSQLSEALGVIGKHDFPRRWPALLPELRSSLDKAGEGSDYATVNGVLSTVNSIFKNFRHQYDTKDVAIDLKYCIDNFAEALLMIFKRTAGLIDNIGVSGGQAAILRPLVESQRLCCRIFYSLNFLVLPECFEDHMGEWMGEFQKYLTVKFSVLEDGGGDGLALVDELRAAVCENISLYAERYEEEFRGYLSGFVETVWNLLVSVSASSGRDRLTVTAITFLTTVSTSVHHTLFSGDDILQQICERIVIPNVMLRDEDEELFEMNYVSSLGGTWKIQNSLALFSENPTANWKHKDCAIYLVVSLASRRAGGTSISTDLVDVESFFGAVIVPELRNQDVNGFPMLKAGALKFFTMFRDQISKPIAMALIPDVVRFLGSDSNVVHSYAASCIEKLLLVKDEGGKARYIAADISPFLLVLMTNLFGALGKPESEENPYVMKCIMRVLGVADISREVASPCITGLTSVLNKVCENPKTPTFNHYLFEAVAVLVRRSCEKDPSLISAFEASLFPSLEMILARDVTEFFPYAFQLLAQLVELHSPPISQNYMQIFEILLSPDSWKKSGNVPALVRLLQAFLQKAPHELNQEGRLAQVLGIFNKLVSSPSTDEQGFYVLNTIIENLGYDVIAPYMPNIFLVILEQFWIPNLRMITGSIELKLTSVASTRLICECQALLDPSVGTLWGKMLDSIVTLLSKPEQDRVEEEPDVPDFADNEGYGATFVHLYNAGKKAEDPLKDIRDPKQFLMASLANLSALSPGRYPLVISGNLDPTNQTALLQLCSSYNVAII